MLGATSTTAVADITCKTLIVTGTAVSNKTYDGTIAATFSGTPALSGEIMGDSVDLTDGTPTFISKNVGNGIAVAFSSFSISGADAGNYALIQPSSTTANIAKKTLTVHVNPISINRGQFIDSHMTVSVTGFVSGESSSLAGFLVPMATAANINEDNLTPGTCSINVTYSGGNPTGNYQFDESNTTAQLTVSSVGVGSGDYSVTGTSGSWSENQNPSAWSSANLMVSPTGSYDQISTDGSDWQSSLTISNETKNGSFTFYLKNSSDGTLTDNKTIYYNLDKTAPVNLKVTVGTNAFTSFLHTITFGKFFNNTVNISFSAVDAPSGIDRYQYQIVDTSTGHSFKSRRHMGNLYRFAEHRPAVQRGRSMSAQSIRPATRPLPSRSCSPTASWWTAVLLLRRPL